MRKHAIISDCGAYRYRLGRTWDEELRTLAFVMLNPSTADAEEDDPTIRKCIGFGQRLGFGSIEVVNLFAYRATYPRMLKSAGYPAGPENDGHIGEVCAGAGLVICAWGVNARGLSQPAHVLRILREMHVQPHYLDLSIDGIPCHPLMLPYSLTPQPWNPAC